MTRDPDREAAGNPSTSWNIIRVRRRGETRIPGWLHSILGVPLEMKLLGANLIIVGVAVFLLFGPKQLQPAVLSDAYIVVAGLILGAIVNFGLVRLALGPVQSLQRVARWVSEGRLVERVPASMVADHELARLSRTINEMLDSLAAGRERMEKLSAEVVYAQESERSQVAQELHRSVGQKLADASFEIAAAATEAESPARSARLAQARELLRAAIVEIRNISRSSHPHVATDLGLTSTLEGLGEETRQLSFTDLRSTADIPHLMIPDGRGFVLRENMRDVESGSRGTEWR